MNVLAKQRLKSLFDIMGGLAVSYEAESIAEGLRQMLENDNLRRKYGKDGQALVREKYGWGVIAEEMEKVYERCLVK